MPISQSKIVLLNLMELCVAVFRGPGREDWSRLADTALPQLLDHVQAFPGFPSGPLRDMAHALAPLAESGDFSDLETEYVRLFIAGPGGIPAPLYESCHLGNERRTMGRSALDMRDRLAAAGLSVALDSNEPPDHLTLELEYLYHLCAEGWASDPALAEQAEAFAAQVMLPWVRRFRDALAGADPHPVYLGAADIVVAVLERVPDA
ncbi:TorA-specific chaperone [Pseudodesulfovibrio indicus]|uniref:TorA-specific chaperone n=2 Tax=Pseudodesulfovibrio indicus TaxID=1716143 RepID=A0AA94TIP9_9BACT|nr:TorA-specific chaperone [Pseudodesulfovibrio indicus]